MSKKKIHQKMFGRGEGELIGRGNCFCKGSKKGGAYLEEQFDFIRDKAF